MLLLSIVGLSLINPAWSARSFDGTNDRIDFGDNANLEIVVPVTISSWINLDTLSSSDEDYGIVTKFHTSGQREYAFYIESTTDKLRFSRSGNGSTEEIIEADTAFVSGDVGNWFFLAITIDDAGNYVFYRNGSTDGSGTLTATTFNAGTKNFLIGAIHQIATSPDKYFDGLIADARLYNKALTAAEIQTAMRCSNLPVQNLTGHWKLNGTGTSPLAKDYSGNGNTGTNVGATASNDNPPTSWCGGTT